MGGQDCDGATLPQAPIGSLPIRSDGLPCPSPTDDDRQISSEDRRSVKLRVRPPPAGTHQCHRATSAGSGMMLTVKLRLAAVFDAQPGGFATGSSPVSWGSIDELFVNLTIPARQFLVLTFAGWVNRHQDDLIAYLREENRVLREHLGPSAASPDRCPTPSTRRARPATRTARLDAGRRHRHA